jgi:hypothetical protein
MLNDDILVKSRHSGAGRNPDFLQGSNILDPGLRRDDEKRVFSTFYEAINDKCKMLNDKC